MTEETNNVENENIEGDIVPSSDKQPIVASGTSQLPENVKIKRELLVREEDALEAEKAFPLHAAEAVDFANASAGRQHFRERFFPVIFGALALLAIFYFFPKTEPPPVEPPPVSPNDDTKVITKKSPYFDLYAKVEPMYKEGRFQECAKFLAPFLSEMISKRENAENDRLLFIYFDSVLRGKPSSKSLAEARELITNLISVAPDDFKWKIFRVGISCEYLLNYKKIHENLFLGRHKKDYAKLAAITEGWIDYIDRNLNRLKVSTLPEKEKLELRRQFEISKSKLLVALWMFRGGKGLASFNDDKDDPGVTEREDALKIAKFYPDDIDCLRIRLFIAETIKDNGGGFWKYANYYYWNGADNYKFDVLETEIKTLRGRINKAEIEQGVR